MEPPPPLDKRALSEEVRGNRRNESTRRGFVFRAKSEDADRFGGAWLSCDDERLDELEAELREYVTTV